MMERDRAASIEALRTGLDLGMTHIDTAEMYGDGAVEELVGEAIAGRRDEVFLVSKVLPHHATRRGTTAACEASCKRLGTDVLDLYLLHWPGEHALEEVIAGFLDLIGLGRIRAWGLSNCDEDELNQAVSIAGEGAVACNQVLYHLGERSIEHEVLPSCARHRASVVAYSPLGQGRFPEAESEEGRALYDVAARHDATPHQVALAFLLRHPQVFVVPKASRVEHVERNAAAAALELGQEDIARIEQIFPVGPRRHGVAML
jgi:diketogulonate reductase-like aldo/keto reductase